MQQAPRAFALLIPGVIVVAVVAGVIAVVGVNLSGQQGSGLPEEFDYDLQPYQKIDPALVRYQQTSQIAVEGKPMRAVAVGLEDRVYVALQKAVHIFGSDGVLQSRIELQGPPYCLAVGGADHAHPGRLYVGIKDHVEVYGSDGQREAVWQRAGPKSLLTSIAVSQDDVFVADAFGRLVWRYDVAGKLQGRIGEKDESRHIPGLVIPSPYFDVAMGRDGLLRVVNPGMHHIEAFTFDGDLEATWGTRGLDIRSFCGCCNPANLAVLPDGRLVTAEKGLARVKVYSETGEFECVVTGPEVLAPTPTVAEETRDDHRLVPVDVAADSRGRILVLDSSAGCVRIFEPKESTESKDSASAEGEATGGRVRAGDTVTEWIFSHQRYLLVH